MSANEIRIKKSDLIDVLRSIEEIVVSIDRIGSCVSAVSKQENDRLLLDYFDQWDVWRKLSRIRAILSVPFSYSLGTDGMDDLERELQDIEHWSWDHREPSKK